MDPIQQILEFLKEGNDAGIQRLVDDDPSVADARDGNGVSIVMQAIYRGRRALAAAIAARKASLDIFEAASLGRMDVLQSLLRDDSAVNAFSSDGFTALHFASYFGQPDAARMLLSSGAKPDAVARNPTQVMPLHSAASARNLEGARLLLEHGAPVNARQQWGWVPIHAAAQNGDRVMAELLLKHGADPAIANEQGQTPAAAAREKGHIELAELLEES